MSIHYRSLLRWEPGVPGGGVKKHYATIVLGDVVTIDEIVKEVEKFCSMTEPDIVAVIAAFEFVIETKLCQSRYVQFNRLGTMYPRFSSTGVNTEEEVDETLISNQSIRYLPGKKLRQALANAEYKKVEQVYK